MPDIGEEAHRLAEEIYARSKTCLMAHSIRSMEGFLAAKLGRQHSIKLTIANTHRFLGKRALAFIRPDHTDILVSGKEAIGFEHQRLAIAHELAHILFHFYQEITDSPAPLNHSVEEVEGGCSIFEKHLCMKHHDFYLKPETIKEILFHSLDQEHRCYPPESV